MSDEVKVTDRRWWANGNATGTTAEEPRLKPTLIEELEARIAEKDREIQELVSKYRGASDEFDQARARLRKEIQKDVERSRRSVIVSFLEVLDNLDRALDTAANKASDPFVHGVALVRQQFLATLEGLGVQRGSAGPVVRPRRPRSRLHCSRRLIRPARPRRRRRPPRLLDGRGRAASGPGGRRAYRLSPALRWFEAVERFHHDGHEGP